MKGKSKYFQAQEVLDKLYKKDYIVNGKEYTRDELYDIYIKLLRESAYLGFPDAQYALAQTYEDINFYGVNPKYSPQKCIYWYTKACDNNVPAAFNNLAGFYEHGVGVKQNIKKALKLYCRACELGDEHGKRNYKIMQRQIKQGKYKL